MLRRRDVSRGAEVSLLSARKFWHALGFPVVDTDEELFTEADRQALATVAGIVREGLLDEPTALAMTRAFARSADRLAGWQSQLIAEAVEANAIERAAAGRRGATTTTPESPLGARCRDRRRRRRSGSPSSPTGWSRCSSTPGDDTCRPRCRG